MGKKESRHPLNRISSRLVLAVLVAVILPFFGLVYFIDSQIDTRLKENIVRQSLLGIAGNLAHEVDTMMRKRNTDLMLMSTDILGDKATTEYLRESETIKYQTGEKNSRHWSPGAIEKWIREPDSDILWSWRNFWRRTQTDMFNRYIRLREVYDLILLVGPDGKLVTCSTLKPDGTSLEPPIISHLFKLDFSQKTWFREAMKGHVNRVDRHITALLPKRDDAMVDNSHLYHIGFAAPVKCYSWDKKHIGVVYALVNWRHIQGIIDVPKIKAYFSGLVQDKEPSPYAWIWGADANTILAHKDRSLYGQKVNGPQINLPQMVEDARSDSSGLYREYTFRGRGKNAAYHHCTGPEAGPLKGGFGWVVGVGIDNEDIFAMSGELRRLLYKSTAVVIFVVILWAVVVARRTTRPIRALQGHMKKVSDDNLETPIHLDTPDEIGDLADAFNQMIVELKEKRTRLVKAEKDAAWREMAQQISHDIKNTLTPIKLSVDLLKQTSKSSTGSSPDKQQILQQTLKLIDNQVTNLQAIALDFYEFAGGRKTIPEKCDLGGAMQAVLELNRAWANDLGIVIPDNPGNSHPVYVKADPMKLHRVLTNIINNAFQAMPDGGFLSVSVRDHNGFGVLEIKDTGVGISEEVKEHLFEPYFTTRSKGTGLGLAIARRVIQDGGGTISLESAETQSNPGTVARVTLPLYGQ